MFLHFLSAEAKEFRSLSLSISHFNFPCSYSEFKESLIADEKGRFYYNSLPVYTFPSNINVKTVKILIFTSADASRGPNEFDKWFYEV